MITQKRKKHKKYQNKISSKYSVNDKWIDSEFSAIGEKYSFYNYSFHREPYNIPVKTKDSIILCFKAEIPIIDFPQNDKLRRVHHSLPYPLPLVFTLTDNHNKTSKLTVLCYHHDPIRVMTQQKKETDDNIKFDWWFQCDDTVCLNRQWLGVSIKDSQLNLVTQGQSLTLEGDELYRHAWSAAKDNLTEISLNWPGTKTEEGQYTTIDLLVEDKKPYALHFTLHTSTSHFEEWKVLPK